VNSSIKLITNVRIVLGIVKNVLIRKLVRNVTRVIVKVIVEFASNVHRGHIPWERNVKRVPGTAMSVRMDSPVTGVLTGVSSILRKTNVNAQGAISCLRALKTAKPVPKIATPALM